MFHVEHFALRSPQRDPVQLINSSQKLFHVEQFRSALEVYADLQTREHAGGQLTNCAIPTAAQVPALHAAAQESRYAEFFHVPLRLRRSDADAGTSGSP